MRILTSFVLLAILLAGSSASGQEPQVAASVSSDTVGVQDQFQLTVTISGRDSADAETPRIPALQGLRVVSGPSIGTQFQWINGRTSSSKSFTYILLPEKEGQFTIGPIDVRVGDKTYKTRPLQIRVTSAPRSPVTRNPPRFSPFDIFEEEDLQNQKPAGDSVFIKAELDRGSVYAGQQVTLSYRVFTQVGINGIQIQENPPLTGFWVEDLEVEKSPKGVRQTIAGREYLAFTVKKQALFPNATGRLKIPSSTFVVSVASAGDIFGIFGRQETLYRKTQETTLEVKPLPSQGRPADFSNAVGAFSLSASIDKTRAAAGEAVALRIKLEGRGNLKMISDVPLPSLPDFTVYSSKRVDNIRPLENNQIGGDKTWEYVLVPKTPGPQTIPSLSFSYFDTEQERYETIKTQALHLDILKGMDSLASAAGPTEAGKQELIRRGTDINFIKLSAGRFDRSSEPFYRRSWFYLALGFPLVLNAAAFLYQRQRSKLAENVIWAKSRKAGPIALKRLKKAEREGKSDARRFYDQAAAAFSGYLADKFNLPEIELTGDNLERTLSRYSVPGETIEATRACLQDCDFERFAGNDPSKEKMKMLSSRIRENIEALEKASVLSRF